MPFIKIDVSKPISAAQKNKLQLEIVEIMPTLPGKTAENTVICIAEGCVLFNNRVQIDGAHIDVRLYKESPEDCKKAFAEKLFAVIEKELELPKRGVIINFIELPAWAANGEYF